MGASLCRRRVRGSTHEAREPLVAGVDFFELVKRNGGLEPFLLLLKEDVM